MQLRRATILAPCHPHEYREEVIYPDQGGMSAPALDDIKAGRPQTDLTKTERGSERSEVGGQEGSKSVDDDHTDLQASPKRDLRSADWYPYRTTRPFDVGKLTIESPRPSPNVLGPSTPSPKVESTQLAAILKRTQGSTTAKRMRPSAGGLKLDLPDRRVVGRRPVRPCLKRIRHPLDSSRLHPLHKQDPAIDKDRSAPMRHERSVTFRRARSVSVGR